MPVQLYTYQQFVAAAGEAVTLNVTSLGGTFAMPAVNSNNTSVVVTNSGNSPVSLQFGDSAATPIRPDMPGLFVAPPNATMIIDGVQGGLAATAPYIAAISAAGTVSITVQRGTLSNVNLTAA